jgi:hypothetical protein
MALVLCPIYSSPAFRRYIQRAFSDYYVLVQFITLQSFKSLLLLVRGILKSKLFCVQYKWGMEVNA